MKTLRLVVLCAMLILSCVVAFSATIYVKWDSATNGPGNDLAHAYHTIAAGLTAASPGDTVQVYGPNLYLESVTVDKTGLILQGLNSAQIRGGNPAISVTTTATVTGFAIVHALVGITCSGGTPTITNCSITNCLMNALLLYVPSTVLNCRIYGNSETGGGTVSVTVPTGTSTLLANNLIANNKNTVGAGIATDGWGTLYLKNNTIVNNAASIRGGGLCVNLTTCYIYNNIFAGNSAPSGYGGAIYASTLNGGDTAYCTFYSNGTTPFYPTWNPFGVDGNNADNPLFVGTSDYRLQVTSTCVNSGDNTYVTTGWNDLLGLPRILATTVDRGCYEGASVLGNSRTSGAWIELRDKPVTGVFGTDSSIYIEDPLRMYGIRVVSSATPSAGDLLTVDGQIGIDETGEPAITPTAVATTPGSATNIPASLGMANKQLGGLNIGLLSTIWGKITEVDDEYFIIDDGSGFGVKVVQWAGTSYSVDDYVRVTGISSQAGFRATGIDYLLTVSQQRMMSRTTTQTAPSSQVDKQAIYAKFQAMIDKITDPDLKAALQDMLDKMEAQNQ